MSKEIRNRFIFVVLLALLVGWFSLPMSFFTKVFGPESSVTQKMSEYKVFLGLDLIGGTELDYRIDLSEANALNSDDDPLNDVNIADLTNRVRDAIEQRINPAGVGEIIVKRSSVNDEEHLIVQMPPSSNVAKAKEEAEKDNRLHFYEEDPNQEKAERIRIAGILNDLTPENFAQRAEELQKQDEIVYQSHPARFPEAFNDQALLEELQKAAPNTIVQKLVETRAEPTLKIGEDGRAQIVGGLDPLVGIVYVSEKITEDRTKNIPPKAHTRHILIGYEGAERANEVPYKTPEEAKDKAQELLTQLQDGADFAALAQEYSTGSSAEQGGDLGTLGPQDFVQPFSEAVFGAANESGKWPLTGALTEPFLVDTVVETQYGFHVIEILSRTAETTETAPEEKIGYDVIGWKRDELRWVKTDLDGSHLEGTQPSYDQQLGSPVVALRFNAEGGALFAEITERIARRECEGQPCRLGAKVGDQWVSRATVREKITGRDSIISGNFTFPQVKDLSNGLNLGAIPAPVDLSGQTTIQAELGQDQLQRSLKAAAFGIGATMLFMLLTYRLAGIVAAIALFLYGGMFLTILKIWPESFGGPIVLSLSGVAGLALSIGLAVDGNILIFERAKEEIRRGQNIGKAIDLGFSRAWSAILDSNLTTLLSCAILATMGSSIIRGFAITLAVGTILSMLSAVVISRTLLRFFIHFDALRKPSLYAMKKG